MSSKKSTLPSAFSLFSKSYQAVLRNSTIFGILYILPLLFVVFSSIDRQRSVNVSENTVTTDLFGGWSPLSIGTAIGAGVVLLIAGIIAGVVIQAIMQVAQLEASTGKTLTFGKVWERAKPLVGRLFSLALVTGLIIIGGLILLVIPGLIFIRRYYLAPYFMIDKNLSVKEALNESAKASKPYAGAIWGVIGVGFVLGFASIVPVVGDLLAFMLGVAYSVAPALRYQEIKKAGY